MHGESRRYGTIDIALAAIFTESENLHHVKTSRYTVYLWWESLAKNVEREQTKGHVKYGQRVP